MKCMLCFAFASSYGSWYPRAQRVTTLNCLPDAVPAEQRRVRGLGSRNFTLGVAAGVWVSQEITSRIVRILVQERLGIHVDVYFAPSLDNPVEYAWIVGCNAKNWDCEDFNPSQPAFDMIVEYWNRPDRSSVYLADVIDRLDPEAISRVVKVGSLGYIGSNDVFLWKWAIDKAFDEAGLWLDWWLTLQTPEALSYFTSYNNLNIKYGVYQWCSKIADGVEVNHSERSKLESLGYVCNSSEEYNNPYRKTRDGVWDASGEYPVKVFPVLSCAEAESDTPDVYDQYLALGYKCVDDGWFISQTCLQKSPGDGWKDHCIIVISWSPDDIVAQTASLARLPVALGTIAYWDAYDEFIYDTAKGHLKRGGNINNVIFEWWTPDNTIGAKFPEESSSLLVRRKVNFEDGWNSHPYSFTTVMHENVYTFAPEVAHLMVLFMISIDEMNWMLSTFPSYINDTFDLYDAEDRIACDWVLSNERTWSAWVGKENCRANTYFDVDQRFCQNCPAGTVSKRHSEGAQSCIPCNPGNIFRSDLGTCMPCGVGTFTNHSESLTECVMCPKGLYADTTGASACKLCPDLSTTIDISSVSLSDCVCARNAYLLSPTVCGVCPVGRLKQNPGADNISSCKCLQGSYLRTGDVLCSACPEGLECPFASDDTTNLPVPLPGFWVRESRPFEVYLCSSLSRCPGGGPNVCDTNRDPFSIGCGTCVERTYLNEQDNCASCEQAAVWPIILASIGAGILCLGILVFLSNRDVLKQQNSSLTIASIIGLTFSSLQALGVFRGLAVQITEPLKSIFAAMELLSFDTKLLKTDCVLGNGLLTSFILRQLIAPLGITIVGVIYLVKKWFLVLPSVKGAFINTVGQMLTVFFISIVASSMSPFIVYKHPGDTGWSVQSIPSVLMFSPTWNALLMIGTFSFAFVAAPFIAMVSYGCYMYPRFIARPGYSQQLHMFRFLYFRFKHDAYFYGSALVARNLFLCLVPVLIRDDSVASTVAMSAVLLLSLVAQLTLQPWKSPLTNKFDAGLTVTLELILIVVAGALETQARKSSVEFLAYLVTIMLFAGMLMTLVYIFYRYFKPNPWYHFFICHHKVGAAAQARYLKLLIVQVGSRNVFIDSDNLLDLDGLFDTVKCRVGHLIVFLTKLTLTRPWCSGEITTACRNNVKTTKFIGPDFETFGEDDYEDLGHHIDGGGVLLAEYMINLIDIALAYRWLLSSTVPSIRRNTSLSGLRPYDEFVFKILGIHYVEPPTNMIFDSLDGLVFSSDYNDFEAVASVGILVRCIQVKYLNLSAGPLIVLSDFGSDELNDEVITDWIAIARASIVVLSVHSLSSSQQLLVIRRNMEMASRLERTLAVPVTLPTFVFPTDSYLEHLLPAMQRLGGDVEQIVELVKAFFKTIAVNLSTHASQTIISTQCDELLSRLDVKPALSVVTRMSQMTTEDSGLPEPSNPKVYKF